ncbi:MAG: DoxX family protein [Bacteroidia bacterium]
MTKRNTIIYWITTLWLSLGMLSTGIVQLFQQESEIKFILEMGYPAYFLIIFGAWKILGVMAILIPKFPLIKEWAYAGFFFAMTGAIFSHFATEPTLKEVAPPLLLLILTILSWYFRPADRKIGFSPNFAKPETR